MTSVVVIGGGNQVAATLIPRLLREGTRVIVRSRGGRPPWIAAGPRLSWNHSDRTDAGIDVLIYLAPLGHFAELRGAFGAVGRYVVFSSTSAETKQASPDPDERSLALALAAGERRVTDAAAREGADATILRPTLIYGAGLDRNLTRLAGWARRRAWFPLVGQGRGLRQPVHADDLAALTVRLALAADAASGTWAVPGGTRLSYRDMVTRVYDSVGRRPRFLPVPAAAVRLARPLVGAGAAAMLLRMAEDLVFDPQPARDALRFEGRPFEPTSATWARPQAQ